MPGNEISTGDPDYVAAICTNVVGGVPGYTCSCPTSFTGNAFDVS